MYNSHPSRVLHELFQRKPYQGADPATAAFIFVGLDANFDEDIEQQSVFPDIVSYLEDGVAFWQERGVHHPFLLPTYSGSGRRYHQQFSKIGFTASDADSVCFVELVAVPTFGQSVLDASDLDPEHAARLEDWIFNGSARHIFLFDSCRKLLRRTPRFRRCLPDNAIASVGSFPLKVLYSADGRTIYSTTHFSHWGRGYHKDDQARQMADIAGLIVAADENLSVRSADAADTDTREPSGNECADNLRHAEGSNGYNMSGSEITVQANLPEFCQHLEFFGYEISSLQDGSAVAKHATRIAFYLEADDKGVRFSLCWRRKCRTDDVRCLALVNSLNAASSVAKWYIDIEARLSVSAQYTGHYDRPSAAGFIDCWHSDVDGTLDDHWADLVQECFVPENSSDE